MGIQHEENIPASFGDAFSDTYLGSPAVVSRLVGEFMAKSEALINTRANGGGKDDFVIAAKSLVKEYADICSGNHPGYKPVVGYHGGTLKWKLMADLGDFWAKNRGKWADDSVCVLFEYLMVMQFDAMKKADGDDMLLEVMLKPTAQYVTQVILGVEKRVRS